MVTKTALLALALTLLTDCSVSSYLGGKLICGDLGACPGGMSCGCDGLCWPEGSLSGCGSSSGTSGTSGGGTGTTRGTVGSTTSRSSTGASTSSGSSSTGFSDGGPQIGSPCIPPNGSGADPCLADGAGLACNPNATDTIFICTLPVEFQECLPAVGCDDETPPLFCTNADPGTGPQGWECVNDCAVTANCPDETTTCQGNICFLDACGPGSLADGGSVNPGGFYAPCDSAGTNDGTCFPYPAGSMTYGYCQENGTLESNSEGCGDNRPADGGTSTLCVAGDVCVIAYQAASSYCTPYCASSGVGPSCSADAGLCEAIGETFVGACEKPCATSADCTAPLTCQFYFCLP